MFFKLSDFFCKITKFEKWFCGHVIKLFTPVIYCHSMAIPSFCVIKLYYLGNYHGMAVIYCGIVL